MKYKRILIKLSGEALMGEDNFGINATAINNYITEIIEVHRLGIEIGIVIGGGNYFRGIKSEATGINNLTGDKMGMLATIMNGLALKDVFERKGIETKLQTAIYLPQFADVFQREKAIKHLQKGRICIFTGGTGNPLFTTDTAAALKAIEIGASILIKATNVDGVYNSDPRKNANANIFDVISFNECIEKDLRVMDRTAFVLCKENNMCIAVMNIHNRGNLQRFVNGEKIGTIIN
jgi:uridylate kinase